MSVPQSSSELDRAQQVVADSLSKPSEGRVYDYYLGGASNFAVDREFAEAAIALVPDIPYMCRENRGFLSRAVNYLVDKGVTQFVDIGCGVPTSGNVHQIAERAAPGKCTVVYVDHDPVACAHATIQLDQDGDPARHRVLQSDLLTPEATWSAVLDTGVLDPAEPIALMLVAVLHFVMPEQHPERIVDYYRNQLPAGSHLVVSHGTDEGRRPAGEGQQAMNTVRQSYSDQSTSHTHARSRQDIAAFFGEWPLVEPGLVWTPQWRSPRPDGADPARSAFLAGVARRP